MATAKSVGSAPRTYALVTAAYNEEKCIAKVIQSIATQTLPPRKWIIVSDGSTDRTDDIVQSYAANYPYIKLVRISEDHPRNFNAQVKAINLGLSLLSDSDCEFVANLDADITLDPDYFERLLDAFARDPELGLSGGYIFEEQNGAFRCRPGNNISSVAHGVHCFRRECLALIGGYAPFSWGGTDTHAGVRLRMLGWKVESIPDIPAYHHRPTGGGFGAMRYRFRGGLMDHYFGTHPLFEVFRVIRRMGSKPYVIGGLVRMAGFLWGYCKGAKLEVSPEFVEFFRKEQMQKLRLTFGARPLRDGKHH